MAQALPPKEGNVRQSEYKTLSTTSSDENDPRITKLEKQVIEQQCSINNLESVIQSLVDTVNNRIKPILNISDISNQTNTNIKSHNSTPELDHIGKSIHTPNIGHIINVDPNTWRYKDSHGAKIAQLFQNSASIVKIQQLRERSFKGEKVYPVNIYFSSQLSREQAVEQIRSIAKQRNVRSPPLHYALTGFPECQRDVKFVSRILGEMKAEKLCVAYAISNFSMTEKNQIIPLYTVKSNEDSQWSKEMDSKTLDFFRSNKSFPESEAGKSDLFLSLKDMISGHLQEIQEAPRPPPFVRDLNFDFIKSPKSKGAKSKQKKRASTIQIEEIKNPKSPKKNIAPVIVAPSYKSPPLSGYPILHAPTPQTLSSHFPPPNQFHQQHPHTNPHHTNTGIQQDPFLPTAQFEPQSRHMNMHSSPPNLSFIQPQSPLLHNLQPMVPVPPHITQPFPQHLNVSMINSTAPTPFIHPDPLHHQTNEATPCYSTML